MNCREFLARYTDFRDGLIGSPRESRHFTRHLASCAACQRYDAALRHGVGALQGAPHHPPDEGFRNRLERRLAAERVRAGRPHIPTRPALAGALLVATAVGLVVWSARHRRVEPLAQSLPPVPFPKPVVQAGLPFVSFQDPRTGIATGNLYPYGTAFVEPASASR